MAKRKKKIEPVCIRCGLPSGRCAVVERNTVWAHTKQSECIAELRKALDAKEGK